MAGDTVPVLLDTDIGSNIDDALALAYLLRQPRCELLGITTVGGEPQVRAQLARTVCESLGRRDIPVHSGAPRPLHTEQRQTDVPQRAVLNGWTHSDAFPPDTAVAFLREAVRRRPGEITLLGIGPMTNVALLLRADPAISQLLKRYVLMGGLYVSRPAEYGHAETNISCDPEAAAVVLGARVPGTTCIGLDVTTRCTMESMEVYRRLASGPLTIVRQMATIWSADRPVTRFHDPLAAAVLFAPELCTMEAGRVEVELSSTQFRGLTRFYADVQDQPHQIAVEVRAEAFFEHYWQILERV